ncbi:hypothetical protein WN944_021694 [Citrus x changshan-huyou]|uniref:Uncharacterized protein n=1 Tax=Citrus x changshan-huyou TaxID=2935761 RepID=A0AAP0MXB9_9ROSI
MVLVEDATERFCHFCDEAVKHCHIVRVVVVYVVAWSLLADNVFLLDEEAVNVNGLSVDKFLAQQKGNWGSIV